MDAGEEIRVVADARRQMQRAVGGTCAGAARARLSMSRALGAGGIEHVRQAARATPRAARAPSANSGLSTAPARRFGRLRRLAGEQAGRTSRREVEDLVADRDAAARRFAPAG